jgi:hypothetical protein
MLRTPARRSLLACAALLLSTASLRAQTLEWPFEWVSNRPQVQLHVDGSGPLWFGIDTGTEAAVVIDVEVARGLGLDLLELEEEYVSQARMGVETGMFLEKGWAAGLRLITPGRTFPVQDPAVLSLSKLQEFDGRPTHGLLGRRFFESYVLEIDPDNHLVR